MGTVLIPECSTLLNYTVVRWTAAGKSQTRLIAAPGKYKAVSVKYGGPVCRGPCNTSLSYYFRSTLGPLILGNSHKLLSL